MGTFDATRRGFSIIAVSLAAVGIAVVNPDVAAAALPPVTASTAGAVYDNIPTPTPGNLPSEAFEAQSVSEFGGAITMTSSIVSNPVVTVLMSSWGCETGHWTTGDCVTSPGATFSEPITLNIYKKGLGGDGSAPGALLHSVTKTFDVPFRPSADLAHCGDGRWYDGAHCYNGFATPITFTLTGITLFTNNVVVSVAYNTSDYGSNPYGHDTACAGTVAGCGYDSLNVALSSPPSVGSDPQPDNAYLNSTGYGYCGHANVNAGSFVETDGCWTGFQPAIRIQTGSVSTVLKANPSVAKVIGPRIYLTLSARLTTVAGNPILGEPITFRAAGHVVCVGTTNANGVAGCTGFLTGVASSIISLGYNAVFAGDGVLHARTAHGPLVRI